MVSVLRFAAAAAVGVVLVWLTRDVDQPPLRLAAGGAVIAPHWLPPVSKPQRSCSYLLDADNGTCPLPRLTPTGRPYWTFDSPATKGHNHG